MRELRECFGKEEKEERMEGGKKIEKWAEVKRRREGDVERERRWTGRKEERKSEIKDLLDFIYLF